MRKSLTALSRVVKTKSNVLSDGKLADLSVDRGDVLILIVVQSELAGSGYSMGAPL